MQREGIDIEQEAYTFAPTLLMPVNDFRRQLPANERPDFDRLHVLAKRYSVPTTAAILRWLEYTDTRAMVSVSNEGFAHWGRPSIPALRSGLFVRTKNVVYELPVRAAAVTRPFTDETRSGGRQHGGDRADRHQPVVGLRGDLDELLQSSSAFVVPASGKGPDQFTYGPWIRISGGGADINATGRDTQLGNAVGSLVDTTFEGFQAGFDTGEINVAGTSTNVHLGVTTGSDHRPRGFVSGVWLCSASLWEASMDSVRGAGLLAALVLITPLAQATEAPSIADQSFAGSGVLDRIVPTAHPGPARP